jgi:hypothetical protein
VRQARKIRCSMSRMSRPSLSSHSPFLWNILPHQPMGRNSLLRLPRRFPAPLVGRLHVRRSRAARRPCTRCRATIVAAYEVDARVLKRLIREGLIEVMGLGPAVYRVTKLARLARSMR